MLANTKEHFGLVGRHTPTNHPPARASTSSAGRRLGQCSPKPNYDVASQVAAATGRIAEHVSGHPCWSRFLFPPAMHPSNRSILVSQHAGTDHSTGSSRSGPLPLVSHNTPTATNAVGRAPPSKGTSRLGHRGCICGGHGRCLVLTGQPASVLASALSSDRHQGSGLL